MNSSTAMPYGMPVYDTTQFPRETAFGMARRSNKKIWFIVGGVSLLLLGAAGVAIAIVVSRRKNSSASASSSSSSKKTSQVPIGTDPDGSTIYSQPSIASSSLAALPTLVASDLVVDRFYTVHDHLGRLTHSGCNGCMPSVCTNIMKPTAPGDTNVTRWWFYKQYGPEMHFKSGDHFKAFGLAGSSGTCPGKTACFDGFDPTPTSPGMRIEKYSNGKYTIRTPTGEFLTESGETYCFGNSDLRDPKVWFVFTQTQ